jgi:hypothetical protein
MLTVSGVTVRAVLDKAHQQEPDEFAQDFLAQLRLENRELHEITCEFLDRIVTTFGTPGMDLDELRDAIVDDDLLEIAAGRFGERMQIAHGARLIAAALVGVVYKCTKAEYEAEDLER